MAQPYFTLDDYTVGWVCALPIEYAAAQLMLDEEHKNFPQDANDSNIYTVGRICDHNVVIACLPAGQTGTNSAAAVAVQMKSRFKLIKFGLMVGIGGGVPSAESDIRLGDVVVSQPFMGHSGVVQYDFGKTTPSGFVQTGSLNAPPPILLNGLAKLRANYFMARNSLAQYLSKLSHLSYFARDSAGPDVLYESSYNHIGGPTCRDCDKDKLVERSLRGSAEVVVHYGTIASGNQVMKDGTTRDRLSSELGGVLCFEMEAAGLMNSFPCLVIRGICDYADSHKNKTWQPYAAATAAACAKEVLSVIPAAEVAATRPVDGTDTSFHLTQEMFRSVIESVGLDLFLHTLLVFDQEKHKSSIQSLDCNQPKFHWVFKNIDFKQWSTAGCSQVIWLSGRPECNINQVSSYIVDLENRTLEKQRSVLYFFCSTAIGAKSIVAVFVHTLLSQIINRSPMDKKMVMVKVFLHALLEGIFKREEGVKKLLLFKKGDSQDETIKNIIKKILDTSSKHELWAALMAVLAIEHDQALLIVVDGLEEVKQSTIEKVEFSKGLREFVAHLEKRISKVKTLLTSGVDGEIKEVFEGLPCIEYDKERKECLASLYFDNARYDKILKEHKGSLEWIWTHEEFQNWSTPDASRLLYIQGKPGSGKSTLTKYFNDNLLEREPRAMSAIVAKFFYSYREGEPQKSHYNMLRSILFDILNQNEAFFYHRFQIEHRRQVILQNRGNGNFIAQHYELLKEVLLSLRDHSHAERLYLIIDAVDESEDDDRRAILNLLFDLCSNTKYCVLKIFVASRPLGLLDSQRSKFHSFIRMQDQTKSDIANFATSLLKRLEFTSFLEQATEYIVEHAQGVFLWVHLVEDELLSLEEEGRPEEDIFEFLKSLPTELEDFYANMLRKVGRKPTDVRDGIKMFQFVLFTYRPLTVSELLHALGIPDNLDREFTLSDESFQKRIPREQRIIHCGGNILEISQHHGNRSVQFIHQTLREFFLRSDGYVANSEFRMSEKNAHTYISVTCIRYLMLCSANMVKIPDAKPWTSVHFEYCAQYLNERPFAKYALCYLKDHKDGCHGDANVVRLASQFIDGLTCIWTVYLLERWVRFNLNKVLLNSKEAGTAESFRNKLLNAAVMKGFSQATEILLIVGANSNSRDKYGIAPLSWAVWRGHEAVVNVLLASGKVEVEAKDSIEWKPLSCAAIRGHEAVVKVLLAMGRVDADATDKDGRTPLSWAAERGHDTVVKALLATGKADADKKDEKKRTPLSWAAERGHEAVVKTLLATGKVEADAEENDGWTPLSWAAVKGHEAVVKILLATGNVKPDGKESNGRTPLSWAALRGHDAVVEMLLETGGVEADVENWDGRTPLSLAALGGHKVVIEMLLATGKVEADTKDKWNERTPLSWAAERGHEAVVKVLLATGKVEVDAKDWEGRTPLSWAAEKGHKAVVEMLLATGKAEADTKDKWNGRTPLSWAAEGGHEAVVKALLATGKVEVDAKDWMGRTPLSLATEGGHDTVVKMLQATGNVEADTQAEVAKIGTKRKAEVFIQIEVDSSNIMPGKRPRIAID